MSPSAVQDTSPTSRDGRHDLPTVAAIAIAVYAAASLIHEGLGHGGACLIAGGAVRELSSMSLQCHLPDETGAPRMLVAAGGTIVQLVIGLAAYAWYQGLMRRGGGRGAEPWRYALWLFAAVNLMQGFGYFLFSGVGGIGDWAVVFQQVHSAARWRAPLAIGGFILYWMATARLFRALLHFLDGTDAGRLREAGRLALTPYIAGGALAIAAGVRNSGGLTLLVISGVAATLGGTSGLAWGLQTLRGAEVRAGSGEGAAVTRSWVLIGLGILAGVAFVWRLGPGIRF